MQLELKTEALEFRQETAQAIEQHRRLIAALAVKFR